jgi:putative membrane-bound dehydrogenase-like protein
MIRHRTLLLAVTLLSALATSALAQRLEVPRRHDRPPGPPLSPEEAVARMTVPEGFSVEIVAAEPDVINPVAMCIDEKGRFWVTESFEYPRREPGPGRDRVKVLEDTTGDGKVDKVTVFADGLNIPSGIAVGYGGVWVANAPDILFLQDTDGDGKADKIEKVVTGFGRLDTHELPNSLTWGPDGWLYGLNGVFNNSHVKYTHENPNYEADHSGWPLTCAMFRIHPRTREFQIFAEGTSNPWGIAFNDEGDAFISACVIDHLWHIVETGYYIRQGGPYPPHTWPMRSIVDHKHQKAAYCGIEWFDSDAYPEEYRNVLYMGNIHGGCINADIVERSGSTYKGKPHPGFPAKPGAWDDDEYDAIRKTGDPENPRLADFLTANDPWFMPVVQKTGPDGCLYILDWYDRYHCYQDANADPEGIDRSKGRLYRVVYEGHETRKAEDLAEKSDEQLLALLDGGNEYMRWTARRLLAERLKPDSAVISQLIEQVRDGSRAEESRLRALWTLASAEGCLTEELIEWAVKEDNPLLKSWGIRLAGDREREFPGIIEMVLFEWLRDEAVEPYSGKRYDDLAPGVLLQLAILNSKHLSDSLFAPRPLVQVVELTGVQSAAGDDPLLSHIVWQNLRPLLDDRNGISMAVTALLTMAKFDNRVDAAWLPRVADVAMTSQEMNAEVVVALLEFAAEASPQHAREVVGSITRGIQEAGGRSGGLRVELREKLQPKIGSVLETSRQHPLFESYLFLGSTLRLSQALDILREEFTASSSNDFRLRAAQTLLAAGDDQVLSEVERLLSSRTADRRFRSALISTLSEVDSPHVAGMLLKNYDSFEPELRPQAIEVLTQRPHWSAVLLKAIKAEQIDKDSVNLNQLKRLALFKNDELQQLLAETYGAIRQDRRSDRQQVINRMRDFLNGTPGDPERGIAAYNKVCGQCHKIYGEGADVGPDITRNGRNDWEQLLQNVFDPSAVIGPGYQARTLVTVDGRVLTGLPVEESDQRVVLKIQGGKTETIPRDQIEAYAVSGMSMMPEDLEKQLTPQEIADLFAFLALDKPPSDPTGRLLPGAPQPKSR